MNRLREEMKIIPHLAWGIALALGVALVLVVMAFRMTMIRTGSEQVFGVRPPLFAIGIGLLLFLTFSTYILLIGYIAADARRRGMRAVLWTLLAIFIPNAIGIILYFILREPLLHPCPKCGVRSSGAFPFCPACGENVARTCPSCRNAVESGWSHCARCGTTLLTA